MSEEDLVKISIPNNGVASLKQARVARNPKSHIHGIPLSGCVGEILWAKPLGNDEYELRNDPLHGEYKFEDRVWCEGLSESGFPQVQGKVE